MPIPGSDLLPGAASFITFPNTEPGPVQVTVTPPDGQACRSFPAEGDRTGFEVLADAVTVATWICRTAD